MGSLFLDSAYFNAAHKSLDKPHGILISMPFMDNFFNSSLISDFFIFVITLLFAGAIKVIFINNLNIILCKCLSSSRIPADSP